ncbi:hypothetical protein L3067_01220 [Xanthomonas sp. PPL568]|uniref:hypothetical protein n=1 Tax=Xanthomonas indica TaxID=2912242 RepID=UPI001F595E0F|nr:hypothetical protein [Xanthomonas indica]MCI2243229.1 hypothetical protein [Xanthomonas indica]
MADLNPQIVRGIFVLSEATEHPFAKFARGPGGAVIILAREMNYCWKRFVQVKELMHHFDSPLQLVGTSEEFESLLSDFASPSPELSQAKHAEHLALWRALGVLCPEAKRQDYSRRRAIAQITDEQIAQELKIPLRYVPHLFRSQFRRYLGESAD